MTDNPNDLKPGFADPIAGSQDAFRGLLAAMSYPGSIHRVHLPEGHPAPLSAATAAVLLTLTDGETPLWLDEQADQGAVRAYVAFHSGAPVVDDLATARFAAIAAPRTMPALDRFAPGDPAYPDRSATLILQIEDLEGGETVTLTGPGIETTRTVAPKGLPADFWAQWDRNRMLFPCGVDVILTTGDSLMALPRTVHAEQEG
ncbi:MAG: phosphonate C-P lyase system protein PhnH [Alphaproteobacteria bacterium]|nr:phosphonate C-P lyase system protein PhnH [Alphaproteobacteria bacterium]